MDEEKNAENEKEFIENIVGNPIHAYKMIKRFAVDWNKIEDDLKEDDWSGKTLQKVIF